MTYCFGLGIMKRTKQKTLKLMDERLGGFTLVIITFCRYSASCCNCLVSSTDRFRTASHEQYLASRSLSSLFDSASSLSDSSSNSPIAWKKRWMTKWIGDENSLNEVLIGKTMCLIDDQISLVLKEVESVATDILYYEPRWLFAEKIVPPTDVSMREH